MGSGAEEKVRLLAVNTPEKDAPDTREACFGRAATEYTRGQLMNARVTLYTDNTQPTRDKYQRLLAYLYVQNATTSFNETLMYTGLSRTYRASPPAVEYAKYERIRQDMERVQKGIWSKVCN
jgi:micrococcal nuclease